MANDGRDRKPVDVFLSYAHEDEDLMNEVRRQLIVFEREGRIKKWHDRQIPPGSEWEPQIDERLRKCQIVLLFVSPAFLESRYCYDVEVGIALERHQKGEAKVIPIILRPCAWDIAPFSVLQALPKDGRPVTQWPDRDQVCLDIARAIIDVADNMPDAEPATPTAKRPAPERKLLPGDRIARLVVPFAPPTGVNIPRGYQKRLNQIAFEIAGESAVTRPDGGYQYPAQFRGDPGVIHAFVNQIRSYGRVDDLGIDDSVHPAELWFEFQGTLPPREMKHLALASDLKIVHCGATLAMNMGKVGRTHV